MISHIISFGFLPAVVLTGYWVVSNPLNAVTSRIGGAGRIGLSFTIGMLLWFPLLFTSAWFNVFNPDWVGAAGWSSSAFLTIKLKYKLKSECREFRSAELIGLTTFALAVFAFNGIYTSESILGGRDQGLYSTHGAHIANTGMLRSELPYEKLYVPENFKIAGATNPGGFSYDIPKGDMYMQFPPTLAIFLAQSFGMGDYEGLLLFNPLVASFSIFLFFALSRSFLDRNWAYLATGFYTLNASQIWNARITLSEIIAQNLILGGLGLAVAAFRSNHRLGYTFACMIASAVAFARVDGFLIPLSIILAHLALSCFSSSSLKNEKILLAGSSVTFATAALAYLYNFLTSPGYFMDFAFEVHSLIGVSFTSLIAHFILEKSSKLKRTIAPIATSPGLLNRLSLLLVILSIYGYFIRPHIEPFAQFEDPHYGTRNYQENSLLDLSQYISLPVLIFAIYGACVAALGLSKRRNIEILVLLIPWLGFSMLYLYDPRISADHIWRIRRFTPIVIPGFVFFAFLGASYLANKYFNEKISKYFYVISSAWSCVFLIISLQPIAFLKQYKGTLDTVRSISSSIPEGALTLANVSSEILGPLQLAEGHKMIRDHLDATDLTPTVLRIIEQELEHGRKTFLLSEIPHEKSSFSVPVGNWKHHIPRLGRTPIAPASEVHIQKRNLYLSQITSSIQKIMANQSYFGFGGTKVFRVEESGLYGQEFNGGVPFRWTNGNAIFTVKPSISRNPVKLSLKAHAVHPDGSTITVLVNGDPIFTGPLSYENRSLSLDLEGANFRESNNEIQIKSNKWVPSEIVEQSSDSRELGIAIEDILLMFDETIRLGNTRFGNNPVRGVKESGLYPTENIESQSFRWTDGHATFSFSLIEDYFPDQIEFDIVGGIEKERVFVVKWNNQIIHEGSLNSFRETHSISLESVQSEDSEVLLELICDPFVPSDLGINNDTRPLGVQIAEIRLQSATD